MARYQRTDITDPSSPYYMSPEEREEIRKQLELSANPVRNVCQSKSKLKAPARIAPKITKDFVVAKDDRHYLITNRHVVLACGLDSDSNNIGGWICANRLAILHNKFGHLGESMWVTEELFEKQGHDEQGQKKRWVEHPSLHGAVDVVALPLEQTQSIQFYRKRSVINVLTGSVLLWAVG